MARLFEHYEVQAERFSPAGDDVVIALHEGGQERPGRDEYRRPLRPLWTVREGLVLRIRIFDDELEALEATGQPRDR